MEPTEIITNNEEVIETAAEEIAAAGSRNVMKYAAAFGLGAIVGIVAYEYAIKPLRAKCMARKEAQRPIIVTEAKIIDETDAAESSDET